MLGYYLTPAKAKNFVLLAGSLVFYTCGEPWYVLLLVMSVLLNFYSAKMIDRIKVQGDRRAVFLMTLFVDVGILAFFKLSPFMQKWMGGEIALPLGISFYTFQILSYLIDVYRREIPAEKSLVSFATYAAMFPQISSGPIVYYSEISGALHGRRVTLKDLDSGMKTFVYGLGMKILVADRLAILWHELQTTGFVSISTPLAWLGAFSYSMQLYFDFYGYSLMAVGLGRMLGFKLPQNFNMPYMAKSIREFYRRWHMTLGRWFRKYIYIPLGGSRRGLAVTLQNLLIVWLLTSFWHGAGAHFFFWGLGLCLFIMLERIMDMGGVLDRSKVFGHLYVLFVVPLTWVCFAIPDLGDLRIYFGRLFGFVAGVNVKTGDFLQALQNYGLYLLVGVLLCTPLPKKLFERFKNNFFGMVILAILFWMCVDRIYSAGNNPFMYLRF